MNDKEIAKLLGEPFALSEKGLKLQKKILDCEHKILNLFFKAYKSPLRYIKGELKIKKGK